MTHEIHPSFRFYSIFLFYLIKPWYWSNGTFTKKISFRILIGCVLNILAPCIAGIHKSDTSSFLHNSAKTSMNPKEFWDKMKCPLDKVTQVISHCGVEAGLSHVHLQCNPRTWKHTSLHFTWYFSEKYIVILQTDMGSQMHFYEVISDKVGV